jgi:hypothetical protein
MAADDPRSLSKGGMEMEINRVASRPSVKGPPDWFTGSVRIDPLFQAGDPARAAGAAAEAFRGVALAKSRVTRN